MTPKEKANELYLMFGKVVSKPIKSGGYRFGSEQAKQCALIAVGEILKSEPRYPSDVDWDDVGGTHQYYYEAQREEAWLRWKAIKYWQEVKQEISNL